MALHGHAGAPLDQGFRETAGGELEMFPWEPGEQLDRGQAVGSHAEGLQSLDKPGYPAWAVGRDLGTNQLHSCSVARLPAAG